MSFGLKISAWLDLCSLFLVSSFYALHGLALSSHITNSNLLESSLEPIPYAPTSPHWAVSMDCCALSFLAKTRMSMVHIKQAPVIILYEPLYNSVLFPWTFCELLRNFRLDLQHVLCYLCIVIDYIHSLQALIELGLLHISCLFKL